MLAEHLLEQAQSLAPRIVALRRAIHAEPELGLETPLTLAKVKAELADVPLTWHEGPSCTGAVAILKGTGPGPAVLLRGDMDALPMPEETGLEFASTIPGRMHACGHDTHTAMLAGAARMLADRRGEFAGEVRFMFQPGEEGYHGARFMLADGLLGGGGDIPLPDAAFALHIMPNYRHGVLGSRTGALLAAADMLEIAVTGRGGHASMPHQTRDPVPVACEIVTAIQALITRRFNAAEAVVVTVSQLDAGSAHNVIPDQALLKGTIRTLSPERRQEVRDALRHLAQHIAIAHECTAEVTVTEGFPPTINDARAVAVFDAVASDLPGGCFEHLANPIMGAEDFSYVLEKVPGAMAFLGVAAEGSDWAGCCGIHSTRMVVDETALPRGSAILAGCALRFLDRGWE
ncbi:amidohydrolase [Croceibacterium sp. LX-88]|uniref:Amidohydrolase n=1 Tax=Croceibacterium selenioxidans TaxID=2838833 RepID=A0ABS5W8F9_9SPHN|nr:M20 family metallopeptidase [Croceibacterium selenioxidans]MBT2135372.1 amidohydrolase [Croceibacterium selenioxidans]